MKVPIVQVPSIVNPIQPSPGFAKKELATYKLDLLGVCQFQCKYCSTPATTFHRVNRERFANAAEQQTGQRLYPGKDEVSVQYPDVLDRLRAQLASKPTTWGAGETLVVSQLTDAFSPSLLANGITQAALSLVLASTQFRIRILTKNAIVGSPKWVDFFSAHPGRFVVGLSTGTLDADWARRIEVGTSSPQARLRATRALQDAGVPTFGMLCPVFPDAIGGPEGTGTALEDIIEQVRPDRCETVWAEPYNDRSNWQVVRDGYERGTRGWEGIDAIFGRGTRRAWSSYATELYQRLVAAAERGGWLSKLRYLLYEDGIHSIDAWHFIGLRGVLLQSKPREDGRSANPDIASMQETST